MAPTMLNAEAGSGNSWTDAAQNAAPPAQSQPQQQPPQQSQPPQQGQQQQQSAPGSTAEVQSLPSQPIDKQEPKTLVLTPQKRGGLLGVMDSIADALTGKQRPELAKDQEGNVYVKQVDLTKGEQWKQIAGRAIVGAAQGLKAGRGHGGGAAAAAGVEAGQKLDQQARQDFNDASEQQQKMMLSNANYQMLRMNLAEKTWQASREKIVAGEQDQLFAQGQLDRYKNEGGIVLGHVAHVGDLGEVLKADPDVMKTMVQKREIEFVPAVDANGQVSGFNVVKMPTGYRQQMLPAGSTFHTFDPTTGQYIEHHASDPMTSGERDDYENKAGLDAMNFALTKAKTEKAAADAKTAGTTQQKNEAEAKEAGARIPLIRAQTREANAKADTTIETGGAFDSPYANEPPVNGVRVNFLNSLPAEERSLVQAIGEARKTDVPLGRSSQNKKLAAEVTTAYPGYDFSRAPDYAKTRASFTSGNDNKGIQALNTAMEHMERMYDNAKWYTTVPIISNFSRAKGSHAATEEKDAKTALVGELAKAYQAGTITQEDKDDWSGRINAWSPLETKQNAVSFIHLLVGKLDAARVSWKNGSPPGAVAPIQFMGPQAQAAWKKITGEAPPAELVSAGGAGAQPPQQQQQQTPTGTVTMQAPDGSKMPVPLDQVDHYKSRGAVVVQ